MRFSRIGGPSAAVRLSRQPAQSSKGTGEHPEHVAESIEEVVALENRDRFLGKRIDYVLRVVEYAPPAVLDMKSVAGPIPMHVTYRFDPHPDGTLASIRIRGDASGYYRLAGPLMTRTVRRNIRKDLRDLERRLTSS